jgi:hypothetical protein
MENGGRALDIPLCVLFPDGVNQQQTIKNNYIMRIHVTSQLINYVGRDNSILTRICYHLLRGLREAVWDLFVKSPLPLNPSEAKFLVILCI